MLTPYPAALAEMMELFKTLPGVGKRSAERMVLSVLKWDESKLSAMADAFQHLKERIGTCSICGNLAERSSSDTEPLCPFCASPDRDERLALPILVVFLAALMLLLIKRFVQKQ